jgi:hypothetical protein
VAHTTFLTGIHFRLLTSVLIAMLVEPVSMVAETTTVRYPEGSVHGFLALRTLDGKLLAAGDLIQTVRGDRVEAQLVFHFKDGSVDDDTAIFSQRRTFRLISDHHIQKGPIFPKPADVFINASNGQVTVHYTEKGREKVKTNHLDLPPDLANGIVPILLKNISPATKETKVSYVGADPEPRLVHLSLTPQSQETFSFAGAHRKAIRFRVKVDIGGIAGIIAPLIGKQPADTLVWISVGAAPTFVKSEGPHYVGGPIWSIELTSPVWDGRSAPILNCQDFLICGPKISNPVYQSFTSSQVTPFGTAPSHR